MVKMDIHLNNHLENAFFRQKDNTLIEKQDILRKQDEAKGILSALHY